MTQRHRIQNEQIMHVTTNTLERIPVFANPAYAREAIECLYRVQALRPFFLYGFVIMPDHCHFLIQVSEPETISNVMQSYKSLLVLGLGLKKVWQKRYFVTMPDEALKVLRYIHLNPVRAGLVQSSEEYPWSSASGKWDVSDIA